MSSPPNITAEHHIALYFETNEGISPLHLGRFLAEVERIATTKTFFGDQVKLEIVDVGTGTLWVEIAIGITSGVGSVAVVEFAKSIKERFYRRAGKLPEAIAALALDNGVVAAQVITRHARFTIEKADFGAIGTVEGKRRARSGYGMNYGNRYGGEPPDLPRSIEGAPPAGMPDDPIGGDSASPPDEESDWHSYFNGSASSAGKPPGQISKTDTASDEQLFRDSENDERPDYLTFGNDRLTFQGDPLSLGKRGTRRGPLPTKSRSVTLAGEFIKVAGEPAAVFDTADTQFDVKLAHDVKFSALPYGRVALVTGVIEEQSLYVQRWQLLDPEGRPEVGGYG